MLVSAFKSTSASHIINFVQSAEKEICRIQAIRSFKNECYGNALDWALRSQDTNTVSTITDYFLKVRSKISELLSVHLI